MSSTGDVFYNAKRYTGESSLSSASSMSGEDASISSSFSDDGFGIFEAHSASDDGFGIFEAQSERASVRTARTFQTFLGEKSQKIDSEKKEDGVYREAVFNGNDENRYKRWKIEQKTEAGFWESVWLWFHAAFLNEKTSTVDVLKGEVEFYDQCMRVKECYENFDDLWNHELHAVDSRTEGEGVVADIRKEYKALKEAFEKIHKEFGESGQNSATINKILNTMVGEYGSYTSDIARDLLEFCAEKALVKEGRKPGESLRIFSEKLEQRIQKKLGKGYFTRTDKREDAVVGDEKSVRGVFDTALDNFFKGKLHLDKVPLASKTQEAKDGEQGKISAKRHKAALEAVRGLEASNKFDVETLYKKLLNREVLSDEEALFQSYRDDVEAKLDKVLKSGKIDYTILDIVDEKTQQGVIGIGQEWDAQGKEVANAGREIEALAAEEDALMREMDVLSESGVICSYDVLEALFGNGKGPEGYQEMRQTVENLREHKQMLEDKKVTLREEIKEDHYLSLSKGWQKKDDKVRILREDIQWQEEILEGLETELLAYPELDVKLNNNLPEEDEQRVQASLALAHGFQNQSARDGIMAKKLFAKAEKMALESQLKQAQANLDLANQAIDEEYEETMATFNGAAQKIDDHLATKKMEIQGELIFDLEDRLRDIAQSGDQEQFAKVRHLYEGYTQKQEKFDQLIKAQTDGQEELKDASERFESMLGGLRKLEHISLGEGLRYRIGDDSKKMNLILDEERLAEIYRKSHVNAIDTIADAQLKASSPEARALVQSLGVQNLATVRGLGFPKAAKTERFSHKMPGARVVNTGPANKEKDRGSLTE